MKMTRTFQTAAATRLHWEHCACVCVCVNSSVSTDAVEETERTAGGHHAQASGNNTF